MRKTLKIASTLGASYAPESPRSYSLLLQLVEFVFSAECVNIIKKKSFFIVNVKAACPITRQASINARASVRYPI